MESVSDVGGSFREVGRCFDPANLPVLTALCREFTVCDRWFSAMPGPTWPNRFFAAASSSNGLDHSPTLPSVAKLAAKPLQSTGG